MFFIEYIFIWSEKIVDLLIGSLLKLVTWILQLIGQGFTYLIGQTSSTSATHGALLFLAFVLVIGLGIIAVYLSPLLAVGLFIFFTTYVNRFKIYVRMGRFIRNCLLCVSDDKKTHSFYHLFF